MGEAGFVASDTRRRLAIRVSPSRRQLWRSATAIAMTCGHCRRGTRSSLPTSSAKRSSGYSSSTTSFRSARDQASFARACGEQPHRTRGRSSVRQRSASSCCLARAASSRWRSMSVTTGDGSRAWLHLHERRRARTSACRQVRRAWAVRVTTVGVRRPGGDVPARRGPGSVDRGEEATGGAIEREPSVLPGRALTESRQSLHVAPDGTGIRLVLLRQRVRLRGLLLRHIQSPNGRVEHRVARRLRAPGTWPAGAGCGRSRCRRRVRRERRQATSSTRPESTHPRGGAGSRPRAGNPR